MSRFCEKCTNDGDLIGVNVYTKKRAIQQFTLLAELVFRSSLSNKQLFNSLNCDLPICKYFRIGIFKKKEECVWNKATELMESARFMKLLNLASSNVSNILLGKVNFCSFPYRNTPFV